MNAHRLLVAAAWAALAAGALLFALNAVDLLRGDVPGDYVGGVVLTAQLDAARGRSAFTPDGWAAPPYRIHLYGPVDYQLGGWLLALAGGRPTLLAGRLLSLAGLALALFALWRLTRRALELSRSATLFGVLAPLAFVPLLIFAPQNRVDTLAVAFSLLALAVGAGTFRLTPSLANALAAALATIAVFTKPTAIAAPAALVLWMASERRTRDAVRFVATAVLLGLAWLAALHALTGGGFAAAVFGFNGANPFAVGGLAKMIQVAFAQPLLPIATGLAITGVVEGRSEERLLSGYFLLALALAVATVGKVGANANYFIEPAFAAAPLLALGWSRVRQLTAGVALAVALLVAMLAGAAPRVAMELRGRGQRSATEAELTPLLAGRRVLTMEVTSVLRAGGTPYLNDPYIFACLARAGKWKEDRLLADLETGAIDVVLADADLATPNPEFSNWSPAVRASVVRRYDLQRVLGRNLFLYLPKKASS